MTADNKCSRCNTQKSRKKFKRQYLQKKRLFLDFLLHFWNVHEIWNIFTQNMSIISKLFPKLLTPKLVVT